MGGHRVLIIDDDEDSRAILKRPLEDEGFTVEEAGDGRAGIEAAKADPPDVILLDHRMPDMDGVDVLTEIRRADVTTPVVAVTGWGDEEVATTFLTQGAVEYLAKDQITPLRLVQTVRSALWLTKGVDPSRPGVGSARAVDRVLVITPRGLDAWPLDGVQSDEDLPTELVRVDSLQAAVEFLEGSRPACALLEVLPMADPRDAVERLLEASPGLPVVVLVPSEGEAAQALEAGATDFIVQGRATALRVRHTLRMARERGRAPGRSASPHR